LRPLAGSAADLFAPRLVKSALVALPALVATTAYVVGTHFGWRHGLSESIGTGLDQLLLPTRARFHK
jgi:hypothetical protein